jgi:hypothetical protein
MTKKILAISLILLSIGLFGCKSSKKSSSATGADVATVAEFVSLIENNELNYESLSAKLNIELTTSKNSISSKAELKTVRDEVILITIQPLLGIEMFRIELTPDSLRIIDRMNKRYVAEKYDDIKGDLPIDFNFYNMQSMLANEIFVPGEQTISKRQMGRFSLQTSAEGSVIKIKDSMNLTYTFAADSEGKITSTTINDASDKYIVSLNYSDFKTTADKQFPTKMYMKLTKSNSFVGSAGVDLSRIQINQSVNVSTTIPDKYKKVTIQQVISSLSKLSL